MIKDIKNQLEEAKGCMFALCSVYSETLSVWQYVINLG